jgi:hypothetical protein
MNRAAYAQLRCDKERVVVPGATYLFEEPGALDDAARLAREWFERHLMPTAPKRGVKLCRRAYAMPIN